MTDTKFGDLKLQKTSLIDLKINRLASSALGKLPRWRDQLASYHPSPLLRSNIISFHDFCSMAYSKSPKKIPLLKLQATKNLADHMRSISWHQNRSGDLQSRSEYTV